MKDRKNIAFMGNQIAPGGGSASLLLMIKSINRNKFNVFVLSSECANSDVRKEFHEYSEKVEVNSRIKQFVSCAGHPPSIFQYIKAKSTIRRQTNIVLDFVSSNKIDILHFNNTVFSHLYSKIRKRSSVKIVTHLREQVHLYNKPFIEKLIVENIENYSNKIISISDKEAEPFSNRHIIDIIANPFDFNSVQNLKKSNIRADNRIRSEDILIGMMGRFAKDKGHLLFIKAAKYFYDNTINRNAKFIIIGVNPPKPKWKLIIKKLLLKEDFRSEVIKYINDNNLSERVILYPYVNDVLPILKELDIYVRPSLYSDPWGRDIIEAMALSRCVIATGTSEFFIKNEHSGFLIEANSEEALGKKIIEVLDLGEKLYEIEHQALKDIKIKTDLNLYGRKIENIYNSL